MSGTASYVRGIEVLNSATGRADSVLLNAAVSGFSHYRILEGIGRGEMGEVYRAEDTRLKRDVALKVLPEQFTQDPQRLARFEREAQLLASLNHPNIVKYESSSM